MSEEYANKLEQWFHSLPGIVQSTLHEPFTWMDDGLKAVSGHPETLLAAGPQYVQIAESVHQLAQQQLQNRGALAGHWTGDAYDSFTDKMQYIEGQLDKLADAIKQVKDLLESGAKACVEGANMIIDIVTSLIMMAIGTLVVNAALSVLTFGASLAAAAAEVIAEALTAVARVAQVLQKAAQILTKLAELFMKLEKLLSKIAQILKEIKEVLAEANALAKASKGWDKIGAKISFGIQKAIVSKGIWAGTGGQVNIPGAAGGLYHAGRDYADAYSDASDAEHYNDK